LDVTAKALACRFNTVTNQYTVFLNGINTLGYLIASKTFFAKNLADCLLFGLFNIRFVLFKGNIINKGNDTGNDSANEQKLKADYNNS
jgi:hypothetical protein